MARRLSHVIGFDDCPFEHDHRGNVMVVGAIFAGTRLDGIVATHVRRDGANATGRLIDCLIHSRFSAQLHAILLQGITFAGFNVVDLVRLQEATGLPVLTVSRRRLDLRRIRHALLEKVPGGARKWQLIEAAGPMEPIAGVYVQRRGIDGAAAARLLAEIQINSKLPEPLRVAHLVAGGVALAPGLTPAPGAVK